MLYSWGLGLDFVTYYDLVVRFEYVFTNIHSNGFFLRIWNAHLREGNLSKALFAGEQPGCNPQWIENKETIGLKNGIVLEGGY